MSTNLLKCIELRENYCILLIKPVLAPRFRIFFYHHEIKESYFLGLKYFYENLSCEATAIHATKLGAFIELL